MENQNLIKPDKFNNPKISGFINGKKKGEAIFTSTTTTGKQVIKFTLAFKKQDGGYEYLNCECWNLVLIPQIQSWEGCIGETTDYEIKTREYQGKTYTDYTINSFYSVSGQMKSVIIQDEPVAIPENIKEELPTINADELNVQMPF
jgi:hypothetical protein